MRGIAGSWLVTGDVKQAPLRDGALVLDGDERIVAVGPRSALERSHRGVHFEAHAAVLMPGLINAHTHLELSALRGRVPGGKGFVPWVDALVAERARTAPELDTEAIDAAISELLQAGVVGVGEVSNRLSTVSALGSVPVLACVFHEVFGMRKDTGEVMLGLARQLRAEHEPWPRNLRYALAPHTAYTLHPEIFQAILAEVRTARGRTSLHLAEHSAERAFLLSGGGPFRQWLLARDASALDWQAPGCDPIGYAQRLSGLGPDVITVHLTDAHASEIEAVARAGSPVVLCPRSNLHIELKLPPLLDVLRAGIAPGLGTDSLASNSSLDPLAEARALAQRFPTVAPRELLAMATSYGADALGFGAQLGRLREGALPGVLAFEHAAQPPSDPERFVLNHVADHAAARRMLSRPAYHRLSPEVLA